MSLLHKLLHALLDLCSAESLKLMQVLMGGPSLSASSRVQLNTRHYLENKMADSQSLTGSSSGSEEDSEEENESGTEEEETTSSEEEEEEEEPLLKYQRFGAGLGFGEEISGDSKMISCIAVHYRVSKPHAQKKVRGKFFFQY